MAFRFRAGEDDIEEVASSEPSSPPDSSQFEGLHKILQQLPKKLLNKEQSVSDSEDTSESSKISEWWKASSSQEAEDSRPHRSGSSLSLPEPVDVHKKRSSFQEIKIAKGRVDKEELCDEVEAAVEIGEEPTPLDVSESEVWWDRSETRPPAWSLSPRPTVSVHARSVPPTLYASLLPRLSCCTALIALSLMTNLFWIGVATGIACIVLTQALWQMLLDLLLPPADDIPHDVPLHTNYNHLTSLRSVKSSQKRGCFNAYNKPYDPGTYSVSQTRPVCLQLKDNVLKITRVKSKLAKRAHFNESDYQLDTAHAYYDLTRCSVALQPPGLPRRRLYSKKYPITVLLGDGAVIKNTRPEDEPFHAGTANTLCQEDDKGESESDCVPVTPALYLFARCDRDKEDWYHRLLKASARNDVVADLANSQINMNNSSHVDELTNDTVLSSMDDYLFIMSKFLELPESLQNKEALDGESELEMDVDSLDLQWLNVLVNRLLFDVCRSPYWTQKIQEKLQKKLSALQLPYYVEEMQISHLDLGRTGPVIHRVSKPTLDERGVWVDLSVTHHGTIRLTIQTKIDLHKLQQGREQPDLDLSHEDKSRSRLYDSEAEDTAESSSDEESRPESPTPENNELDTPGKTKKKTILQMVESVAQSRAVRRVAKTKVVQNIIAGVSNTNLSLTLEVKGIQGTLAINIPPPPSDRFWYGFRGMPQVDLTATPQFGNFTSSRVKNWIEKKLIQEFQMQCVLPHMNKILLPGDFDTKGAPSLSQMSLFAEETLHNLLVAELEASSESAQQDASNADEQIIEPGTYRKIDSRQNSCSPCAQVYNFEEKRNSSGCEEYNVASATSSNQAGNIIAGLDEDVAGEQSFRKRHSAEVDAMVGCGGHVHYSHEIEDDITASCPICTAAAAASHI